MDRRTTSSPSRASDRPLVSVLMAAYNHESFVAESIESVCEQTHRPLELIVVDDRSSDATPEVIGQIADEARRRLDQFVFERQKRNRGVSRTLNRALRLARGEFVTILGTDDAYLPDTIEHLLAVPEWADPTTAVVFGDACIIDERGGPIGILEDHSPARIDDPNAEKLVLAHYLRWRTPPEPAPLGSYASMLRGPYIPVLSTMTRRSALDAAGGFDEGLVFEDYGLWLTIARDHRIVQIPDVLAKRRLHGRNVSIVNQRPVFRDMLDLMVREKKHARSDPVARAERIAARDRNFQAVQIYGTTGDLLRVLARHPIAGPRDLLEARRAVAAVS